MTLLPQEFFAQPAQKVARELLGKRLVRLLQGQRVSGFIVETEAYCDAADPDLACHGDRANQGRPTARTAVMFGPAGHAYVYFTYGVHWMFNVVTGRTGEANAVLIRALQPEEGVGMMRALRRRPDPELTNGPAKLAQALEIDKRFNGVPLFENSGSLWLEEGLPVEKTDIARGPRIGLGKTPEPWLSIPWRFWMRGNPFVSR